MKLSSKRGINDDEGQFLNDLVVEESLRILELKGQYFKVGIGKKDKRKHKLGMCYANAFDMMKKGYYYVEGYLVNGKGKKFAHAWNMDKDGIHLDFTLDNNEGFIYRGVIVPNHIVWDVGYNNGGVTYAVLPYIDDVS